MLPSVRLHQPLLSAAALAALLLAAATPLSAQRSAQRHRANREPVSLSGPRVGFSVLPGRMVDSINARLNTDITPVISQFGWQFETRLFQVNDGLTGVTEWVLLAGGLEQGVFLPSGTWLVGLRTHQGAEFGVGPNLSAAGAGLAAAGGVTLRSGGVNFPMNLAIASGRGGARLSFLTGFNFGRF